MAKQVVTLPYHIKIEAENFADEEIRQLGKSGRNHPSWKKAFDRYVKEAYENSLVPAKNNPGTPKVSANIVYENYPEIFGPAGFISKATGKKQGDAVWNEIDERIRGAVGNLFQLYVNVVLGLKTKRDKGVKSLTNKDELSIFEFASKTGKSLEQQDREVMQTLYAQYARYLVEEVIYEMLIPLLEFTKDEVREVMLSTKIGVPGFSLENLQLPETRSMFITALRNRLKRQILRKPRVKDLFFD